MKTFLASLLMLVPHVVAATMIYSYEGQLFSSATNTSTIPQVYSTEISVSGTFKLSSALTPSTHFTDASALLISYSFTDGANVLTDINSILGKFEFWIDALGEIEFWDVRFQTAEPFAFSFPSQVGDQIQKIRTEFRKGGSNPFDKGETSQCGITTTAGTCLAFSTDSASRTSGPTGTWTITAGPTFSIPEPDTFFLFTLSLFSLVVMSRKTVMKNV